MKAPMRLTLLSLPILALAACASMDEPPESAYAPAAEPTPSLLTPDEAYMAYVERTARRRGIEVVWVHAPTKRPADELADND